MSPRPLNHCDDQSLLVADASKLASFLAARILSGRSAGSRQRRSEGHQIIMSAPDKVQGPKLKLQITIPQTLMLRSPFKHASGQLLKMPWIAFIASSCQVRDL